MSQIEIVLASQSPRRRELLGQLGFKLRIAPPDIDESVHPLEPPRDYVARVASEKAAAIEGELVIAADTAVVLDDTILGKPADAADAMRMLRSLSGRSHQVLTGVAVRRGRLDAPASPQANSRPIELGTVVSSEVHFAELSDEQITWYVGTHEPLDKAGAYALQGAGGAFVRAISGSVSNVVGLPIFETMELFHRLGVALPWEQR